jgi:hypothetical protein
MHFNTKYINIGDSEKEIKDKVNYNFNQILSFAIGKEGLIGPKGATGIPGPSGKMGSTGPTGNRASEWLRSTSSPSTGSSQEFDLWIDDSSSLGDIYERGISSWSYTGLSLFNSSFFEVYSNIVGPLGLTDKSAIGFKSTYTPDQTSLVLSDSYLSGSEINPNNSKLLVSTGDQITNPIFSFVKSNGNSSESPSFYWKTIGPISDLLFNSPGKLSISSLLGIEFSSFVSGGGGDVNLNGVSLQGTTLGGFDLLSPGDIRLFSGPNSLINISSLNLGINSDIFYTRTLTEISNGSSDYVLKSSPVAGSSYNYFGGISVNSSSTTARVFDFTGISGGSILYGLPSGTVTSGNHKQVVFGETGGVPAGSTGGPYSYHVKRLNNIVVSPSPVVSIPYIKRNNPAITIFTDTTILLNVFNVSSSSLWNSNMIVVTNQTSTTVDGYIYIPSSYSTTFEPLFYSEEGNEYRVYLNDMTGSNRKIKGILYPYTYENTSGQLFTRIIYIDFPSSCSYVDLFWAYKGSNTNPNGRIFWKTCTGDGGVLEVTNQFTVTSNPAPPISSR